MEAVLPALAAGVVMCVLLITGYIIWQVKSLFWPKEPDELESWQDYVVVWSGSITTDEADETE